MLKSYIFYNVDIHYNSIRQKLTLSVSDSIFEHKYKNKYDISNIRLYPIHLHPYLKSFARYVLGYRTVRILARYQFSVMVKTLMG